MVMVNHGHGERGHGVRGHGVRGHGVRGHGRDHGVRGRDDVSGALAKELYMC